MHIKCWMVLFQHKATHNDVQNGIQICTYSHVSFELLLVDLNTIFSGATYYNVKK